MILSIKINSTQKKSHHTLVFETGTFFTTKNCEIFSWCPLVGFHFLLLGRSLYVITQGISRRSGIFSELELRKKWCWRNSNPNNIERRSKKAVGVLIHMYVFFVSIKFLKNFNIGIPKSVTEMVYKGFLLH